MKTDIPGYKIIRTLGQGGMATVYLAIQVSFEREVALKIMSPALSADPSFGERFSREARIVSRLVHPNIVTVYDVGVHEGQHFLSMEYVPGHDLKQKRHKVSLKDAVRIVKDVARALDFAGKKGYVHRDVKPENIMLHEEDGRAVLMDFGIARPTDTESGMTQTGTAIGTPHYMSPEQAKGKPVDLRSDLYSLGVVLYLLLVGNVPFDADSAVAVGIKHVADPIPRLPGALARFQAIVDRVLAKDPDQRYQNGAEFIADLNTVSEAELTAMEAGQQTPEPRLGQVDANAPTVVSGSAAAVQDGEKTVVTGSDRAVSSRSRAVPEAPKRKVVRAAPDKSAAAEKPAAAEAPAVQDLPDVDRLDFQQEREHSSVVPWVAGVLVAAVVATFVYLQQSRPEVLQGLVDRIQGTGKQVESVAEAPPVAADQQPESTPVTEAPPVAQAEADAGAADRAAAVPGADADQNPPDGPADQAAGDGLAGGDVAATEQGEVPVAVDLVADRVRELRKQLDQDLSVAPELAQVYRDVLQETPDHQQARWGLKQLRDFHLRNTRQAFEEGDLARVRLFLESARVSFPDAVETDSKYQRLVSRLEQAERHQALIEQGNQFLAEDALGTPAGANALERFRAVLAEDADNPRAQQGIAAVAARYGVLAEGQLQAGDLDNARRLLDRGLEIAPDDEQLQALAEAVTTQRLVAQELQQQLAEARRRLNEGRLVTPRQDSAFDLYQAVLSEHPGNAEARQGLVEVERRLADRIASQIRAMELESARQGLVEAQSRFASAGELQGLQMELDLAFEARALAAQPKIPQVIVSNAELTSIADTQADTLQVDRTIHIGFSYQNFERATSVVQAILYDGARSLQIAQVPVIVSGNEGVTFFRIDRPVEGFAEGGYNIDLLLGGDRLTSAAFKVESGGAIP